MAEDVEDTAEAPKKKSGKPLILGLLLAVLGGGAGFFATWSGMIPGPETRTAQAHGAPAVQGLPDIAFVEMEPLVVALQGGAEKSHLHFRAHLEVPAAYRADVELLLPRVVDVLNSYLRALQTSDIENPSALARLRAQMLRRVQIVTGQGRVNDLLIMEFVIN